MTYSRWRPYPRCKGICDQITPQKKYPVYGYFDGGRYCRVCEAFYVKEIVDAMDRNVYCPCCRQRTTARGVGPARYHRILVSRQQKK